MKLTLTYGCSNQRITCEKSIFKISIYLCNGFVKKTKPNQTTTRIMFLVCWCIPHAGVWKHVQGSFAKLITNALGPMELGFRCLVWCNLQKHKEVTCGFVNLVKSDAFLTWKLAVMFQRLKAATQIPSNGRLYPTLLVGGYSLSKALCWGSEAAGAETKQQRSDQTAARRRVGFQIKYIRQSH